MTAISGTPTFGPGRAFARSTSLTNPTPIRMRTPQSQSIDFKRKTESLFGGNQLAEAVAAGTMEVSGKIEYGKAVPRVLTDLMFDDAGAPGSYLEIDGEVDSTSSGHSITVANASSFLMDLGVINQATGVSYTRTSAGNEVANASYSVTETGGNKGIYAFASGDANVSMSTSYLTSVSGSGEQISLTNQAQGVATAFQAVHVFPYGTEQNVTVLNNCVASSTGISAKQAGYGMTTLEYTAGADNTGTLGTATFAEVD